MKPICIFLSLCTGYVPDDLPLSHELSVAEVKAKQRAITIEDGTDPFEDEYFNWQVSQVVWPRPVSASRSQP